MEEIMLKIENVSKQYVLGQIGGTTLRDELQRLRAKRRGEEDPTRRIGAKVYNKGEKFLALDSVSFEVKKGERVGIIGHNGAGKSTLLKLISRVTAPTSGWIGMNGRVASMLEVGTGFHQELTGRENVYMNGAILGMTKKEIDAKMEDIIEFSECRQFIDTPVKRYSSGMYVKLAFSVAAHLDSEIMIMDEVLAVGDMAFQKKCLDKMSDVSKTQGRTILYVSHNMNTIRQLCDRVIVLDHGEVVFDGDVEAGIGVYMEVAAQTDTQLDYSLLEPVPWVINNDVKLLNITYPNRESCIFNVSEHIIIRTTYIFRKNIDHLNFRIVLQTQDGIKVAAAFSKNFCSGQKGETFEGTFDLNAATLAPGSYQSYVVFYEADQLGNDVMLEWRRGLDIVIEDKRTGVIPWRTVAWGHLMLPDPIAYTERIK